MKYFIHGQAVEVMNVYLDEKGRVVIHVYFQNDGFEGNYYYEQLEMEEE